MAELMITPGLIVLSVTAASLVSKDKPETYKTDLREAAQSLLKKAEDSYGKQKTNSKAKKYNNAGRRDLSIPFFKTTSTFGWASLKENIRELKQKYRNPFSRQKEKQPYTKI